MITFEAILYVYLATYGILFNLFIGKKNCIKKDMEVAFHDSIRKGLGPYLLNFVGVNMNVELSFALKLVKLRFNKVHN
jgi:hypothetical protein